VRDANKRSKDGTSVVNISKQHSGDGGITMAGRREKKKTTKTKISTQELRSTKKNRGLSRAGRGWPKKGGVLKKWGCFVVLAGEVVSKTGGGPSRGGQKQLAREAAKLGAGARHEG